MCILTSPQIDSASPTTAAPAGNPLPTLPGWTLTRLRTPEAIRAHLPAADREDNFWLRPEVLAFLSGRPQGFDTEAIVVTNHDAGLCVLLTVQVFTFSASGNVREGAEGHRSRYDLRRRLLGPFTWKVVALGQFLTSGPYCSDGLEVLPEPQRSALLSAVADTLLDGPDRFSAVLLKDLFAEDTPTDRALRAAGYYRLPVDPVMELPLDPAWKTPEDYQVDLTSKYRVRYRRARGKFAGLDLRPLTAKEVEQRRQELHDLYRIVGSGADYNAAELTTGYLPWLARNQETTYGESGLTGYFDGPRLIGFTSTIRNGDVLHAHYLGMVDEYKRSHHLYHNMLFDLLEIGLKSRCKKLDYGRTALEIKSSVGAAPQSYACVIKARNGVLNRLIPVFTPAVYRPQRWQARQPFRV